MSDEQRVPQDEERSPRQQRLPLSWEAENAEARTEIGPPPATDATAEPQPEPGTSLPPAASALSPEEPAMPKPRGPLVAAATRPAAPPPTRPTAPDPAPESAAPTFAPPSNAPREPRPTEPKPAVAAGSSAAALPTKPAAPVPETATEALPAATRDSGGGRPVDNTDDSDTADATEISAPAVGQMLREARLREGLTVEEVARRTRIRVDFVRALEADDYTDLPIAGIYAKRYLRSLCEPYGLDPEDLLARYRQQVGASDSTASLVPRGSKTDIIRRTDTYGEDESPAGTAMKLSWALALAILTVAVVLVVFVVMQRLGDRPPAQGLAQPTELTEKDVEKLLVPEMLPLTELDVPDDQP